jgi:hypothetical protein
VSAPNEWHLCKRSSHVSIRAAYYTHVHTLCGREVLPERATEIDEKVSCHKCLVILCDALRRKIERICSKIHEGDE